MTFDKAAITYDQDFTLSPLAQWLRARVWARLDALFVPGMRVLEIGCGTGVDAVHLAQRGVQVVATDASPAMLNITSAKAVNLPVETHRFDLNQPSTWTLAGSFDGVYSNFGVLNCTPQWPRLAEWLSTRLTPNAAIGLGVMGRFCLWETLWHGLHLDFKTASRRWSGSTEAILPDGSRFPIYYPSAKTLTAAFAPHFIPQTFIGLGVFLPPSDSFGVIEARPQVQNWLIALEKQWAHRAPWRSWADHYWLELAPRAILVDGEKT